MKSLLLSLILAPALAFAADDAKPKKPGKGGDKPKAEPEAVFKKLDKDSNASLSLDEFKASPRAQKDPAKAEEMFKKMDKDSDGKVTLEEFKTHPPHKGGDSKPEAPKTDAPKPEAPKTDAPK